MKPLRLWIGLVFLTLGAFGILDATGTIDAGQTIDKWWPVAIIGLGVVGMITDRRISLGPLLVVGVGSVLLVDQLGGMKEDLVGPVVLIAIGVAVLSRVGRGPAKTRTGGDSIAMFGGSKITERSEHFAHSDVSAVFGGATLDLREAHIDGRATVDALALFGGVDVLVPKGWRVTVGGLPIFGGYADKTDTDGPIPQDAPELAVNATAIFGGVDVKNKPD